MYTINKDLTWRLGLRENMTTGLLSRYYIKQSNNKLTLPPFWIYGDLSIE